MAEVSSIVTQSPTGEDQIEEFVRAEEEQERREMLRKKKLSEVSGIKHVFFKYDANKFIFPFVKTRDSSQLYVEDDASPDLEVGSSMAEGSPITVLSLPRIPSAKSENRQIGIQTERLEDSPPPAAALEAKKNQLTLESRETQVRLR